jgi:hypothetical protein
LDSTTQAISSTSKMLQNGINEATGAESSAWGNPTHLCSGVAYSQELRMT